MPDTNPDQPLVVVFHAGDPEVLPLAEAALEQEGIEYLIRAGGGGVPVGFGHTAEFGGAENTADILVNPADADRAAAALADLTLTGPVGELPPLDGPAAAAAPTGPRAYRLTEVDSGAIVGEITAGQFDVLVGALEEESATDHDYYIDAATIEVLSAAGADAELLAMLKRAIGSREGVEIAWTKL